MRPSANFQSQREPAGGFHRFPREHAVLYLRRDLGPHAEKICAKLDELRANGEAGLGNRRSGFRVIMPGAPELFARRSRRGGLIASLLDDLFVGVDPRPLKELRVADQAYRRGLPVAEPIGAMVEWVAPMLYRGFFLTRALTGMSLWELMRTDDDPVVRRHVLEQARHAIETIHQGGLFHADLNLHNLLVTKRGESFAVVILDLDKAQLLNRPLPSSLRRRNSARLIRSARTLDREGRYFDARALSLLNFG